MIHFSIFVGQSNTGDLAEAKQNALTKFSEWKRIDAPKILGVQWRQSRFETTNTWCEIETLWEETKA